MNVDELALTKKLVFGTDLQLSDPNDYIRDDQSIKPSVVFNMNEYLTTGGGRYATPAASTVVQSFFNDKISGLNSLAPGDYTYAALIENISIGQAARGVRFTVLQYGTDPNSEDFMERAYIFGSTGFSIGDDNNTVNDIRFHVNLDRTYSISGMSVHAEPDDFDFQSSATAGQAAAIFLNPAFDPYGLIPQSRTTNGDYITTGVDISYVGPGRKYISYSENDFKIDLTKSASQTNVFDALKKYAYELSAIESNSGYLASINADSSFQYITEDDKHQIFGTNDKDYLTATSLEHATNGPVAYEIVGGSGDDIIKSGTMEDRLWGGRGNDLLAGHEGSDTLNGGDGEDYLFGASSGVGFYIDQFAIDAKIPHPEWNDGVSDLLSGGWGRDIYLIHASGNRGYVQNETTLAEDLGSIDILDESGGDGLGFVAAQHVVQENGVGATKTVQVEGDYRLGYQWSYGTTYWLKTDSRDGSRFDLEVEILVSNKTDETGARYLFVQPQYPNGKAPYFAIKGFRQGDFGINIDGYVGPMEGTDGDDRALNDGSFSTSAHLTMSRSAQVNAVAVNDVTLATIPDGDQRIHMGAGNDVAYGRGGNDEMRGDGGNDTLDGGEGNDRLTGGLGSDSLFGGLGDDTLIGSSDADDLDGGDGIDTADFSEKTTTIVATLNGVANAVVTVGGTVEDTLRNVENLTGGSAADILTGDSLVNVLTGGAGNDTLTGGAGNDILAGGAGVDRLDGGTGSDTADFSDKITVVAVALNGATNATVTIGGIAEDTLRNVENLVGGSAADFLTGDSLSNVLTGGAGNDTLVGGAANDTLIGGAGGDTLDGGTGTDTADYSDKTTTVVATLNGATNSAVTVGGTAEDTLRNVENLIGGSAADTLTGDNLANVLAGGSGNDVLKGLAGADTLDGGAGLDTTDYSDKTTAVIAALNGAFDITVTVGGTVEDTIRNIENLTGGSSNDSLTGDGLANSLTGGAGNDTLDGGTGTDTLNGGVGDDTFLIDNAGDVVTEGANEGTDLVRTTLTSFTLSANLENLGYAGTAVFAGTGNTLANVLVGGVGNDVLMGVGGTDTLDGGVGLDTADFSDKTSAVVATLNGATNAVVTVGGTAEDTIRNIENLTGGSAADTLTGDGLANVLTGGTGNDTLRGLAGSDTYTYNVGDGIDAIFEGSASSDTDKLVLGAGILASEVIVTRASGDANDAVVSFSNRAGSITIDDQFSTASGNLGVEQIVFADGTVWDRAAILARLGGTGTNTINGTSGNDTLTGTSAAETINGLAGNDILKGLAGADTLDGGASLDTADYSDKTTAVVASLNGASDITVTVGGTVEDTIRNIENLTGGSSNDTLRGDTLANVLSGGAGNDTLKGQGGADTLDGGAGTDTADFSDKSLAVVATLNGATNAVVTVGGTAEDTIRNIENITGGSKADTLTGDALANTLSGGIGDDSLAGAAGNDTLIGGAGADRLDGGAGTDFVSYASSSAAVTVRLFQLGVGGDAAGDAYIDVEGVIGSAYADLISGQDHIGESIRGGAGDDELYGFGGNDTLDGEAGNDFLQGGVGNDSLLGGAGDDALNAYDGNDLQTGGAGNDTFMFNAGFGKDVISDFVAGAGSVDVVQFDSNVFASYAAVAAAAQQVGADTLITVDASNTLTLKNVALSSLHADDFRFV